MEFIIPWNITVPKGTNLLSAYDTQEKIIKMIKENPKVSTADMAKELKIGIATVKRKIKKMSNVSYVGSGYSGHWEINE